MSAAETTETEWHAWRAAGITASDIARAASGRYGGACGVVADKLGIGEPVEENERMARGHLLEDRIATATEALLGLHIVGEQAWCQHQHNALWRATLDGMAAPVPTPTLDDVTHVVETKTRAPEVRPAWDYWNPQVQWQMLVTGIPAAVLAECVVEDGDEPRVVALKLHLVEADELTQSGLADLAEELWAHIQAGTLPEPTAPGELDVVKNVLSTVDADAETVDLSEMADDVARLAEIKAAMKTGKEQAELIEARIRHAVGHATHGTTPTHKVTIARPRMVLTDDGAEALIKGRPDLAKTVLDVDKAKAEAKGLYEAARKPIGARVLTIKENA